MAFDALSGIQELKLFSVCQVSDALGPDWDVETGFLALDEQFRICGRALTVKCAPDDNLTLHHALSLANPGDVLVVESGPGCRSGLWGELMSLSARNRKLGGTVIDGAVRDRLQIREIGYPVFAHSLAVRRTQKERYGAIQCPVRCGALTVNSGDVVLADADGIISIPFEKVEEVVALSSAVARKESAIEERIHASSSIFEILELSKFVPKSNG